MLLGFFGCDGKRDDLHHYIICPNLFGLCKFLNKGVSHMPLERIGLCNPTQETMVHICCAYAAYHSLINYVSCRSDTFFIGSTEKLLNKASNKAWSVFAEAYRAEAQGFRFYAPCYLLPAGLEWRFNTEDPTQTESSFIFPEPICNLTDSVAIEIESDSDLFSHFF